jgi:hypothetical protein
VVLQRSCQDVSNFFSHNQKTMASEASEVVSNADGGVEAAAVTIPKMKDESEESIDGDESGETNGETNGAPHKTQVPPWSQMLQSPRGVESFSPSLEVSKPENLHGIGEFLVLLSKSLTKRNRRITK